MSRRSQRKWDFQKEEIKKTNEDKEMEQYLQTMDKKNSGVLGHLPTETVANESNEQDDQLVKQPKCIGEDKLANPLSNANFSQLYRDKLPQNHNVALSEFVFLPKNTADKSQETQKAKKNPGAITRFQLFYNAMERIVERHIGKRSVAHVLHQIWANMGNSDKEKFKTESMKLQYAFQKNYPELDIQGVDCDQSTKYPVILTTTLREKLPKDPICPLIYFRQIMTPEVRKNNPEFKHSQVLHHVEQLWSNLSEDETKRNAKTFRQVKANYDEEAKKRPERRNAIRKMKEKKQEELEPFLQFCNRCVESFVRSNPTYKTFTTPQEQLRSLLVPPTNPRKRPFYDAVQQITWETSQIIPVPVKKPVSTQSVNHVADSSEDADMDLFKDFFPEYQVDTLPKHPDNFVTKDLIPAKKIRYQDSGEPITQQLSMTSHFSGDEFDVNEGDWNDHEMNGYETGYEELFPQEEQIDQNFAGTQNFGRRQTQNLAIDHTTAFGRFSLLECINLDGETLRNFTDEMMVSFLQNRWDETPETRKADFELIGTYDIGNTSQALNGPSDTPFDRFCNHAIEKISLDALHPDEIRSLLGHLWNLNSNENKAQYYIMNAQRNLNDQRSAMYPDMPTVKEVLTGKINKKKKTKKNQVQRSSFLFASTVLNPSDETQYHMMDNQRPLTDRQVSAIYPDMSAVEEPILGNVNKKKKTKKNKMQCSSPQVAPKMLDPADISLY